MLERLSSKLIKYRDRIYHWCPACRCAHGYEVPRWNFNGDAQSPTFTPSMLIYIPHYDKEKKKFDDSKRKTECHYFVKAGNIEFCGDCPHEFKGKTVPLPDFPAGYGLGEFTT